MREPVTRLTCVSAIESFGQIRSKGAEIHGAVIDLLTELDYATGSELTIFVPRETTLIIN
jgi:hypothetical protein